MNEPQTQAGREEVDAYRKWFHSQGFQREGWDEEKSVARHAADICRIEAEARAEGAMPSVERLAAALYYGGWTPNQQWAKDRKSRHDRPNDAFTASAAAILAALRDEP